MVNLPYDSFISYLLHRTIYIIQKDGETKEGKTNTESSEARNSYLLANSNRWLQTISIVARSHHRAQESSLYLFWCVPSEQAHDIVHHSCITRQGYPSIACEAKLILRHPQELPDDRRAEVRQWHLKPPPVSSVHGAVALHCHWRAALSTSFAEVHMSLFLLMAATLCHFLAIWESLLALIMVVSPSFLAESSEFCVKC